MRGPEIIDLLSEHVLSAMRRMSECDPDAAGAGNKDIETEADLGLDLDEQDGYLTWSILQRLAREGLIEIDRGPRGRRYKLLTE